MSGKYFLIVGLLLMMGCGGGDDPSGKVTLPTDLDFQITVAESGTGKVDVVATALNENFFTVNFGTSGTGSVVTSNDGKASFTYTKSGTYSITVQAHVTGNDFISKTKEAEVVIKDGNDDIPDDGYTTPSTHPNMTLVWEEQFTGTALNESSWTFEVNGNGGGNNELQYYRRENTQLKDGYLVITAKKEAFEGKQYTSSRIVTKGKHDFKYGRIDIRALLPKGQGIWPALWMLGANIDSAPWPKCGEIDIMEMVGGAGNRDKQVYGTLHWDNNGARACTCEGHPPYTLSSGTFNDEFHVFTITWTTTEIKWYVDDQLFNTVAITPAELSEFHNNFFFIINLAVGGNWPGDPDGTTVFPQRLVVDYVRVFKQN